MQIIDDDNDDDNNEEEAEVDGPEVDRQSRYVDSGHLLSNGSCVYFQLGEAGYFDFFAVCCFFLSFALSFIYFSTFCLWSFQLFRPEKQTTANFLKDSD